MKKQSNFKDGIKIVKLARELEPNIVFWNLLFSALNAAKSFIPVVLGAQVVTKISVGADKSDVLKSIVIIILMGMVINLASGAIDKLLIVKRKRLVQLTDAKIVEKAHSMDYQVYEKAEVRNSIDSVKQGINSSGGIDSLCSTMSTCAEYIISIIYAMVLSFGLFKVNKEFVASTKFQEIINSYWLVPLLAVLIVIFSIMISSIGNYISKAEKNFFDKNIEHNRKHSAFWGLVFEYSLGKSIRIFKMQEMITKKQKEYATLGDKWFMDFTKKSAKIYPLTNLCVAIIEIAVYVIVGMKVILGLITLGQLTQYVGAIMLLCRGVSNLVYTKTYVNVRINYLKKYVEFLELPNEKYDGTLPIEKRMDNEYQLEFKNVSFHYPNSDDVIIKNLSLKINVGGKLAIVGKNGAGKSTFIKLLCRLYDPTEGEILLNGIDIRKYDFDEYRRIFAVVFQDFELYPMPVGQVVASNMTYDKDKVLNCLYKAGIKDRVLEFDKELETYLYNNIEKGVEISGGEAQKIAIARALYKDSPVVILDEPTAALDPVSELEIYNKFNEMVNEKTSIYISHRMSSCKFCENILVLDNGTVAQYGSHNELVNDSNGLYYSLWSAQAKYYE